MHTLVDFGKGNGDSGKTAALSRPRIAGVGSIVVDSLNREFGGLADCSRPRVTEEKNP